MFLFLFCSRQTAYIVRDNAKTFTSLCLSWKDVIYVKIKWNYMLIFWSQSRGNTVEKVKGSVWLRKQQFDFLPVQSRAIRFSMLPFVWIFKRKGLYLGFTTLLTSQVISVAFHSERETSDKFCSAALISAWGSFTCCKSTTRNPRFYFPSEESHAPDFYALKQSISPGSGLNPRTSDPVASYSKQILVKLGELYQ